MNIALIPPLEYTPRWFCQSCSQVASAKRAQEAAAQAFLERLATLSDRERQVMYAMCSGRQPAAIAALLNLSVKTVSTYRCRLLEKLELTSNVAVALACERAGLLGTPTPNGSG